MLELFTTFLISVIAGVIADYIYNRLTDDKKGNEEN